MILTLATPVTETGTPLLVMTLMEKEGELRELVLTSLHTGSSDIRASDTLCTSVTNHLAWPVLARGTSYYVLYSVKVHHVCCA
jgi:hypothetical protein